MNKYKKEIKLKGQNVSPGIALGKVFMHNELDIDFTHSGILAEEVRENVDIFREAIEKTKTGLRANIARTSSEYGEEFSDIFLGQMALIEDDFFLKEVEDEIKNSLVNAEIATFNIFSSKKDYFLKLDDEYFHDRAFDISDLKKQIIYHIKGENKDYSQLTEPAIVVATHLSPTDAISYDRKNILGFITEVGGKTSHTAILSRSLNIPYINGITNIHTLFEQNANVIIDGLAGTVFIHPFEETEKIYHEKKIKFDVYVSELVKYAQNENVLKDGTELEISANVEFVSDLAELKKFNINSIGLFRSEGYFLAHNTFPNEETQFNEYDKIEQFLPSTDAVIRTLDIGGDKIHKKYENYKEDNPFLGWRAIRVSLDEVGMFQTQLRAILRASAMRNFKIMLPMVTDVSEIRESKAIINQIQHEFDGKNIPYDKNIPIGIMIETPASAFFADKFADEVDFFSIGTNDLVQYFLAVDRGNEKVSYLYQENHPAILRIIENIIEVARKKNIWVSMCGEMASEPASFPLLVGMGLRKFSMTPQKSVTIKRMMADITVEECENLYNKVKHCDNYIEVGYLVTQWIRNKFPNLLF
jgi:phosphotransferase system enzyme I (PtsI)